MAELPYMPFFVDAYMLDAGHLTEAEHGVYLRLLMLAWASPNCRLPNDDAWLARRLQRPVETIRETYRPIISEFWATDGNWVWQKRQQKEWQRAKIRSEKQTVNAKSRWEKEKASSDGICDGSATAMPTTSTSTSTETKNKTGKPAPSFAWAGDVIRLNEKHLDAWTKAAPDLDVPAWLFSRDTYLQSLPEDDERRGRWFLTSANALAKAQQNAATEKREAEKVRKQRIANRDLTGMAYVVELYNGGIS